MAAIVQPLNEAHWKQTVKTGIAGSLAMFLANTLHLPQPYWAAVAVIVMQSEFNTTLKVGFTRIGRHLHRCVVAIRFAQVMQGNIAAFAVAVVVTVLVCSALKLEESQRLAASTVALIMLLGHPQARWLAGIQRFLEVSFGIIVSLLVARFIWPAHSCQMAQKKP
jgi:uncharacterized membrane protein YgaE (UPF0421/DUF939 family)